MNFTQLTQISGRSTVLRKSKKISEAGKFRGQKFVYRLLKGHRRKRGPQAETEASHLCSPREKTCAGFKNDRFSAYELCRGIIYREG